MKNWKETILGNVVEVVIDHRGLTPKKLGGDWADIGYRAISAKSIKNGQLVNEEQMNILPKDLYRKWMKEETQYGDIFLTSEAPLGEHIIWKSDEKLVLSQRIFGIRTKKEKLDPFFFNYFIDSKFYQHELKSKESGSTVTGIKQSELLKTRVLLPSLEEQKEIAVVLGSLDDKIELLREENKTLEATAQTLFKEWFMNFNFPNAEGKSYKSSGGKMIDSELGLIPNEWCIGKLGDEFNITIGRTPPRGESEWFSNTPTGKKWISIKDIGNSEIYISNTSEYLTDEAVKKFNIPIIPENTTVLSFKMTVGKLAITTEEMLSNEAIAHLKIKEDSNFSTEFIYSFLEGLDFNSLGSTSSIVTAINSTMIKEIGIFVPSKQIMRSFNQSIQPIFSKLRNNNFEIQTLSILRDTLLPKLMNGSVKVL